MKITQELLDSLSQLDEYQRKQLVVFLMKTMITKNSFTEAINF
jgi:hypothetical protein